MPDPALVETWEFSTSCASVVAVAAEISGCTSNRCGSEVATRVVGLAVRDSIASIRRSRSKLLLVAALGDLVNALGDMVGESGLGRPDAGANGSEGGGTVGAASENGVRGVERILLGGNARDCGLAFHAGDVDRVVSGLSGLSCSVTRGSKGEAGSEPARVCRVLLRREGALDSVVVFENESGSVRVEISGIRGGGDFTLPAISVDRVGFGWVPAEEIGFGWMPLLAGAAVGSCGRIAASTLVSGRVADDSGSGVPACSS